ncbi:hypothetical protein Tco_0494796 [Tanacetum coccineum]
MKTLQKLVPNSNMNEHVTNDDAISHATTTAATTNANVYDELHGPQHGDGNGNGVRRYGYEYHGPVSTSNRFSPKHFHAYALEQPHL